MVSDRSVNLPAGREEAAISAGQRHEDVLLPLTRKRRRWTPAEKQAIVLETYQPGMSKSCLSSIVTIER